MQSYQLRGAGVRLQTQAGGVGSSSRSEWLESLPQLLSDEGHEGGEQGQRHRYTVIEDTAGHLPGSATVLCGRLDLCLLIPLDQHRLHILLQDTHIMKEMTTETRYISTLG